MIEDYLKNKHAETYIGTDDDMIDNFVRWLEELPDEQLAEYVRNYLE